MKPAPFAYCAPTSVAEALSLRAEHGTDSAVLAGGQSLIPLLSLRMAQPDVLIDLGGVPELAAIRTDADDLVLGAMTRQRTAERSQLVRERAELLTLALPHVAHPPIRNRGTIGGTLAHADPAAELPAVAVALGARFVSSGPDGRRVTDAEDFFEGFLSTALTPEELLLEVRFASPPPRSRSAFVEYARRDGDFAIVGVAAVLALDEDGLATHVRLVFTGVGVTPIRSAEAESVLLGQPISETLIREAAEGAAAALRPSSDAHGSADYRRHVAAALARRALTEVTS